MYENGLSKKEQDKISEMMFGPGSVALGPSQQRLLDGTIELGFPKAGMFCNIAPSCPPPPSAQRMRRADSTD